MILVGSLIAGHIVCGALGFILERDRLRNTLLLKTELQDYKRLNYSHTDHKPSRRKFSNKFEVSLIKGGFCVSRHKYTNNVILRIGLLSLIGGAFYLLGVLGTVTEISTKKNCIISDDYDTTSSLIGNKILSNLNYDVFYFAENDIELYTKSSILYTLSRRVNKVKLFFKNIGDKVRHYQTMMNVQR